MLAVEVSGTGAPLALVHGFTQTARTWGPMLPALARHHSVLAVDAPGHGDSADLQLGLWTGARELVRTIGRADYLGYSMGGRLCLHAALTAPDKVQRLILIGATAGILDPHARSKRRGDDEKLAAALERAGDAGLPRFLKEWLSGPLFQSLSPDVQGLEERLQNTAAGLASSLRLMGTGVQEPLDERLPEITVPVLLVVGQRDTKFRAEAERLAAGLVNATTAIIAGAGHACHLEKPDLFLEAVEAFLHG